MFGFSLSDLREQLSDLLDAQWRAWAGAAFVAMAMAAIEYDEIIAPEVNRMSDAWGAVASDLGRKVASFAL